MIFPPVWPWNFDDLGTSSMLLQHHFLAIGEFKIIQSGNAQFGSKSTIFWAVWPWDDLVKQYILSDSNWNYSPETLNYQMQATLKFEMTLQNNRAPLLCYFKLCAYWWIQTWLQSGNTQSGSRQSRVTLKFDGWLWKTIGHLSYPT